MPGLRGLSRSLVRNLLEDAQNEGKRPQEWEICHLLDLEEISPPQSLRKYGNWTEALVRDPEAVHRQFSGLIRRARRR